MRPEHWIYTIPLRLRSLFRRRQADQELDQELRYHVEQKTAQNVAKGMSAQDARRAALLEMGGIEKRKEECRDTRRVNWLQDLLQDLRFGLRMLRKSPGFTAVAVLTLALGIGANTAIFSAVNAALLRPLPYIHPEQLVRVWGTNSRSGNLHAWASYPDLQDWRAQNTVFSALGAYDEDDWTWTGGKEPEQVGVCEVTADFFSVFGVQPQMGRVFLPEEFVNGQRRVVILSHTFWVSRFASDPSVLGRSIRLEDKSYTIVGVMPETLFQFPSRATDLWVALPVDSPDSSRGSRNLNAIARLRPGVTLAQAQAGMNVITGRLRQLYPDSNAVIGVRLEPLQQALAADSRSLLLILFGVVAVVLLIASGNVANMLFSRVKLRDKEFAVRLAVGASRFRVVRQLLTESLLLTLLGGVVGILLAGWGTRALLLSSGFDLRHMQETGLDRRVLFFAALISLIPGLLIGLVPALQASKPDLVEELKEGARGGSVRHLRLRSILVVAEVAMSMVLLVGAGLLLNSFWRLYSVAPGFDSRNVLTLRVSLPDSRYPTRGRALALYDEVLSRLRTMPGVDSAAVVSMLPLGGGRLCNQATLENDPSNKVDCVEARMVTPDYFRLMRIPLLKGRWFSEGDSENSKRVTLVDETFARLLSPQGDAVGKRFAFRGDVREVVGVVGDVRQLGLGSAALPEAYLPLRQAPVPFAAFVVRTKSRPEDLAAAAREQIWAADRDLLVFAVQPMEQVVSDSIAAPKLRAVLLGSFAALALFLAIIGLASLVAYGVTQRTHEFGVRLALGATPRDILFQVLGQGMQLTLLGVAIGVVVALALTRLISALLFSVPPGDPLTFAGVSVVLTLVALLACYIPARRAMRVDPMVALRYE